MAFGLLAWFLIVSVGAHDIVEMVQIQMSGDNPVVGDLIEAAVQQVKQLDALDDELTHGVVDNEIAAVQEVDADQAQAETQILSNELQVASSKLGVKIQSAFDLIARGVGDPEVQAAIDKLCELAGSAKAAASVGPPPPVELLNPSFEDHADGKPLPSNKAYQVFNTACPKEGTKSREDACTACNSGAWGANPPKPWLNEGGGCAYLPSWQGFFDETGGEGTAAWTHDIAGTIYAGTNNGNPWKIDAAKDGQAFLVIEGIGLGIRQTVPGHVVGATYRMSFWAQKVGDPAWNSRRTWIWFDNVLRVRVGSQKKDFSDQDHLDMAPTGQPDVMNQLTFEYIADATHMQISFMSWKDVFNHCASILLDGVTIVPV